MVDIITNQDFIKKYKECAETICLNFSWPISLYERDSLLTLGSLHQIASVINSLPNSEKDFRLINAECTKISIQDFHIEFCVPVDSHYLTANLIRDEEIIEPNRDGRNSKSRVNAIRKLMCLQRSKKFAVHPHSSSLLACLVTNKQDRNQQYNSLFEDFNVVGNCFLQLSRVSSSVFERPTLPILSNLISTIDKSPIWFAAIGCSVDYCLHSGSMKKMLLSFRGNPCLNLRFINQNSVVIEIRRKGKKRSKIIFIYFSLYYVFENSNCFIVYSSLQGVCVIKYK